MIPSFKNGLLYLTVLSLLLVWGCEQQSDDIPTGVPVDVGSLIENGWDNFVSGDYADAVTDFLDATSRNALATEAYLGLGWSHLRNAGYSAALSAVFNVFSLIDLGLVDPASTDRFKAESYACQAGAYQGLYPSDIHAYAPLVVENVDNVLELMPNFVFTYDTSVNARTLKVAKADAYFVQGDFINALKTISELDSAVYYDTDVVAYIESFAVEVETLYDSTTVYGYGRLNIDTELIDVVKVTDDFLTNSAGALLEYHIENFVQGGGQITFYGAPPPQIGDLFLVNYYYSPDYDDFKARLRTIIDSYR